MSTRIDAVRAALLSDRAAAARYGVAVEVSADGTLLAVRIDETVTPYGRELGALITTLAAEALEQARTNVREHLAQFTADPRIIAARESLEAATELPPPPPRRPAPTDYDLSEDELAELNERRNRSYFD